MTQEGADPRDTPATDGATGSRTLPGGGEGRWLKTWMVLSSASAAAAIFTIWEVLQRRYLPDLDPRAVRYLYVTRGIALAFFLAAWSACLVLVRRRSVMARLRGSESRYRRVIEGALDAIVVLDPRGMVLEWNPQAVRLFGYTRREVIGRPLPTLPPDTREAFFRQLERLANGDEASSVKCAAQKLTRHGEVLDVSVSLLPLRDAQGRTTAFLETSCDIRACNQLVCKLQQVAKMSSMGQLAAGVAHQLNTPLASALLRAQMLEEDTQDAEQVEDLRFIQRQLRYGKEIVEGLLRFGQPAREMKRAEPLNPILHGVLAMLGPSAHGLGVHVTFDIEATEGALIYMGRNELEQVCFNLVSNALDAMPRGGELTVATRLVQGGWVEVIFRDSGVGIPNDRLPRIFEPFYTTKEPGKGTGLGLAICWRILEEAGGSIDVSSELGKGTTFSVRLPIPQNERTGLREETHGNAALEDLDR